MKKAISMIVLAVVLFYASTASFAASVSLSALKSIKYIKNGSQDEFTIYTPNYKGYKVYWIDSPDRLIVDIPNNKLAVQGKQNIPVNSQSVSAVRFSQFTKTAARVVFDTKGRVPYTVKTGSGSLTITIGKALSVSRGDGEERPDLTDQPDQTVQPEAPEVPEQPVQPELPVLPPQKLSFSSENGSDRITIPGANHDGYNIFRLTDPDRVVIDVPNLSLYAGQEIIESNGKFAGTIRTSALDTTTTRIVMDTAGQPQYRVENTGDGLAVVLEESTVKNMTYHNAGDRVFVSLDVAKLMELVRSGDAAGGANSSAEEAWSLRQLYSENYDGTGMTYTMTFPADLANIGSGTLHINDGVIDYIDVTNDAFTQITSLTFHAKSRLAYHPITNLDTYSTEVNILESYSSADRLVVIDPGHGGSDPGANYGDLLEKDLNLKIALKVNEILKDKGVKTYMTRDDDTFIPLHTRADLANNLNASLFLSIHNNAFNSSEYGTETLYYPGDTGSGFARIVQDTLVNALGTNDRGIIQRPNLVVLNSTKMPAVIAEIAFLTNPDDRAKLTDDSFLQKAAEALADAVVKALG